MLLCETSKDDDDEENVTQYSRMIMVTSFKLCIFRSLLLSAVQLFV